MMLTRCRICGLRLPGLIALVVLCSSCTAEQAAPVSVVAKVGSSVITADEFVMNYEFGFSHLKTGDDPKRAYLERMIDEKLLALGARDLGLSANPETKRRIQSLREKLLVEAVFERFVNQEVEVSEEEILRLMNREAVEFKLRTLPAPTLREATRLRRDVVERGMVDVLTDVFSSMEVDIPPQQFESPFLHPYEVNPELLAAIEDLPIGTVSEPIPYRGSYLLVEIVDVRREPVTRGASSEIAAKYRETAFQVEAKRLAGAFITKRMEPLDVRVKGPVFARLKRNLWPWYSSAGPAEQLGAAVDTASGSAGAAIRSLGKSVLFTTSEGAWTVDEFLDRYPADRYPLSDRSEEQFTSDLYDAIGLTLRDRAFVADAEALGLDRSEAFQRKLTSWSDKWLFRAMVEQIRADVETGELKDAEIDMRIRSALEDSLRLLRDRFEVEVNERRLATLEVAKTRTEGPNVILMERHSGMPAIPIVDPWWQGAKLDRPLSSR